MIIISGYQSGCDIAGIRAAHEVGFPTGGWIPKGFLTEHGPRPEYAAQYGAVEHTSSAWSPRTFANVKDSDATIIFRSCRAKSHRGSDQTKEACAKLGKPAIVIHVWNVPDTIPPTAKLAGLIRAKGFQVINIAGTRSSSDPGEPGKPWTGIEGWCFCYCLDLFTLLGEHP